MEIIKAIDMICSHCGDSFKATPPEAMDDYALLRWKEQNRLCDSCAQLDRIIPLSTKRNEYNPGKWDPKQHDSHKIGLGMNFDDM